MAANGEATAPRLDNQREETDLEHDLPSESTPLLRDQEHADQSQPQRSQSAESLLRRTLSSHSGSKKSPWRRRWPSILSLLILCLVVLLIIVFVFLAPSVVEQYANEAIVFEPTSLGVDSFTETGVRARIQGDFSLDASRVKKKSVRDLGKLGTWFARKAETGETDVEVSLPERGNVVLGTAHVPRIVVDVRNRHTTHVDFLSDLEPGEKEGIRGLANDWIDGRLGQLRVLGKAKVKVKSGILRLGTQTVRKEIVFANDDVPSMPDYDIKRLNFHEGDKGKGMEADVSLEVENKYPFDFEVPSLGFDILVQNCRENDPYIEVAKAANEKIHVRPKRDVEVNAKGVVRRLPKVLTQDCPNSDKSPLDNLLGNYIRGKENTIYVRGSSSPSPSTPKWVDDLISDIIVPVPLPGKTMGHLIRNFSLEDTHFDLPDPWAPPTSPKSNPRISAKVKALVALPEEMNFNISANRVRANATVFYKGDELGTLDLRKWQRANSTLMNDDEKENGLLVESKIERAPLHITDEQVFADVIQELVFAGNSVTMRIKADVDVQVETALGEFKVRRLPAKGSVPVKPISSPGGGGHNGNGTGTDLSSIKPKITDLQIVETNASSLKLAALVNVTNPTDYSASIPYVDIHILKNGSLLGHVTVRDLHIKQGNNSNLLVHAVYAPKDKNASAVGRELLSRYVSGWNTSLTAQTHAGSIPSHPQLGKALSRFAVDVPTPRLHAPGSSPGDGDDDSEAHFIKDATMHLLTSTATFTLLSPLPHTILYLETINATAFYKSDPVGRIFYDLPFAVPPVDKDGKGITTPRLPVNWSLGSVGYDAVKKALGGELKLDASAVVDVRLEDFRERLWFQGKGIGAKVRL